jgi:hypothetical protein
MIQESYSSILDLEDRLCDIYKASGFHIEMGPKMFNAIGVNGIVDYHRYFSCGFLIMSKTVDEMYAINFIYSGDSRLYNFCYDSIYSNIAAIDEEYIRGIYDKDRSMGFGRFSV